MTRKKNIAPMAMKAPAIIERTKQGTKPIPALDTPRFSAFSVIPAGLSDSVVGTFDSNRFISSDVMQSLPRDHV